MPVPRASEPFRAVQEQSSSTPSIVHDSTPTRPTKHVVLTINTSDGLVPLLFVDIGDRGQLLKEQALFARLQKEKGEKLSKIRATAKAIGRYLDWVIFAERNTEINGSTLPQILTRFYNARYMGTVDTKGFDKHGLNWLPVKRKTADNDLRLITKFSDFVSTELGYEALNPQIDPSEKFSSGRSLNRYLRQKSTDFLFTWLAAADQRRYTRSQQKQNRANPSASRAPFHWIGSMT